VLKKIISGGQTGVDRGALDAARALGAPIGGWVPRGRLAEDGPISADYPLQETITSPYEERTRRNVHDSDGTLIISHGPLRGGARLTLEVAIDLGRPHAHLDLSAQSMAEAIDAAVLWIARNHISTLNIAGPRQSEDPDAYHAAYSVTTALLSRKSL
jgi:Circularly permutated YpsA SLOG family